MSKCATCLQIRQKAYGKVKKNPAHTKTAQGQKRSSLITHQWRRAVNIPLLPYYYVLAIAEDESGNPSVFLDTIHGSRKIPENFLVLTRIPLQENFHSFFFPLSGMKFLLVTIAYLLSVTTTYGKNLRMIEDLFTRRLREKLSGQQSAPSEKSGDEFPVLNIPGFGDFVERMFQPFLSDIIEKTLGAVEDILDRAVESVKEYSNTTVAKNA